MLFLIPVTELFFFISLTQTVGLIGASLSSCKLLEDPIEVLKCEVEELTTMNNQLKLSIEEIVASNDIRYEKLEVSVDEGKRSDNIQNWLLKKMTEATAGLSSRCDQDACGPCSCNADYQLTKKYYCSCQHLEPMQDCLAFRDAGFNVSGLYLVHMKSMKTVEVLCDQETDDGGWTVISRRMNGKTNFYRDWVSYKEGFGNAQREFWLGNDNIYLLTWQAEYPEGSELMVDMEDWYRNKYFAKYETFSIDNEEQKYELHVKGFSGNGVVDSLAHHDGNMFSTYDNDNDGHGTDCANSYRGAWWYNACHVSNLNGLYQWIGETQNDQGVVWHNLQNSDVYLKFAEMKVRRKE